MDANPVQPPSSAVSLSGTIRGMGRSEVCELLLEQRPVAGPEFLTRRWPPNIEWTLLRAPLDLPDGDYTVTTADGHRFHAARVSGFWIHRDTVDPPPTAPETDRSEAAASGPEFCRKARHLAQVVLEYDQRYAISLIVFAALIVYGLPTIVEFMAAQDLHLGFAVLLFGDLIGCACLATFLEMPVFGIALYLLLTIAEACLYFTHYISPGHLALFTDLVPMAVVVRRIARLRSLAPPVRSERLPS